MVSNMYGVRSIDTQCNSATPPHSNVIDSKFQILKTSKRSSKHLSSSPSPSMRQSQNLSRSKSHSERQHPNYFDEKIQEQEDQENNKLDIEMGIHRKKNHTIMEMFSRRRHKK